MGHPLYISFSDIGYSDTSILIPNFLSYSNSIIGKKRATISDKRPAQTQNIDKEVGRRKSRKSRNNGKATPSIGPAEVNGETEEVSLYRIR